MCNLSLGTRTLRIDVLGSCATMTFFAPARTVVMAKSANRTHEGHSDSLASVTFNAIADTAPMTLVKMPTMT